MADDVPILVAEHKPERPRSMFLRRCKECGEAVNPGHYWAVRLLDTSRRQSMSGAPAGRLATLYLACSKVCADLIAVKAAVAGDR